jgi:hypothetical protein
MGLRSDVVDTIARLAKVDGNGRVRVQALVTALDEHDEDAILGELSELEDKGLLLASTDGNGDATIEPVST